MSDDSIFFLSQYFKCKQADIEWLLHKVSSNYCLQISHIIFDFHVNVANDMWILGFKGSLHILINPIFFFF